MIRLPQNYEVYDFSNGYDANRLRSTDYGIGKYNEKRVGMYDQALFSGARNIHVGVDISAPVGTEIYAFADGEIHSFAFHSKPGDYGYTLITEHEIENQKFYSLFGHLSKKSLAKKRLKQGFHRGEILAWIGDKDENGGWNPHLHFQLSLVAPERADLPGVVAERDLALALEKYPDPRIVLGPVY